MIRPLALALALAQPAAAQEAVRGFGPEDAASRIVLRTTTDIDILGPTVEAFIAARPGLAVRFEQWGSNDLYELTRQDCRAGEHGADIVISSGVHQMVKLVNDGCASEWHSPATQALPPELRWRDEIWGVTREPAVIVYNRDLVPPAEVPLSRFDLLDLLRPADTPYGGKVATYDIEESGLGYLFAFMDSQEASTFGALMEAFARTGAVATCCSAEIIAGVASGEYLIAYNVLGSYAETAAAANPVLGVVIPNDYALVLSRAAILPRGSDRDAAGAFLEFLLSDEGRQRMARTNLIAPDDGFAGEAEAGSGGRRILIGLGLPLLIALDQAKTRRFIARWRDAFEKQ